MMSACGSHPSASLPSPLFPFSSSFFFFSLFSFFSLFPFPLALSSPHLLRRAQAGRRPRLPAVELRPRPQAGPRRRRRPYFPAAELRPRPLVGPRGAAGRRPCPPGGGPGRLRPCPLQTGPRWGGGAMPLPPGGGAPASGRPGSGPTPRKGPGGGGVPASRRWSSGRRPGRLAAPSGLRLQIRPTAVAYCHTEGRAELHQGEEETRSGGHGGGGGSRRPGGGGAR